MAVPRFSTSIFVHVQVVYLMALRMLSRFVVLLALYTSVMFVGNMHFRQDDIRLTGQHVRTLVAAMRS